MAKPKDDNSVSVHIGGNVNGSQILASNRDINLNKVNLSNNAEINLVFSQIFEKINSRPEDPKVDKEEIVSTVEKVKEEINKGDEASTSKVERWFKFLAEMSPDIFDVVVSTLANPIAGVGEAIRKIAKRAKIENS